MRETRYASRSRRTGRPSRFLSAGPRGATTTVRSGHAHRSHGYGTSPRPASGRSTTAVTRAGGSATPCSAPRPGSTSCSTRSTRTRSASSGAEPPNNLLERWVAETSCRTRRTPAPPKPHADGAARPQLGLIHNVRNGTLSGHRGPVLRRGHHEASPGAPNARWGVSWGAKPIELAARSLVVLQRLPAQR
jgi:hypothetical protein